MNVLIRNERKRRSLTRANVEWFVLAAAASFFAVILPVKAQAPVITSPTNLFLLDTNEAFDPTAHNGEGSWVQKAKMPTPRSHLVVCEVNNIIYAIGGYTGAGNNPSLTTLTTSVEAYDPVTDTWTTKTPMPQGRGQPACGTIDGIVYVAGGYDDSTAATATVYAFDPAGTGGMGSWTQKQDMPQARYGAGYCVIDGKLFVVGQNGGTMAYDPVTDTWDATRADMPTPRGALGAAASNDILYAISGGISNALPESVKVEAYDPATDQWTTKTPIPTGRDQFGIGVFNNVIYAVGGQGIRQPIDYLFNDVEAFDPTANGGMGSWTQKTPMPTARAGFNGRFVNGIFYAIGGTVLGTAVVGQPFIYQITATNNPTSYTADESGEANPFPPGLTLDPTSGLIYGVPTTAGRYREHFHATNASGTGNSVFDIGVFPAPDAGGLTIVSSTSATGRTAQAFSFQALVTGGSPATHFSFGNLPDGLNGNAVTGIISGTPASDGNFVVAVTAIDGASEATGTLQLTFISDSAVPIITSAQNAVLAPGQSFSYTMTADQAASFKYVGSDGALNGGLPAGLSFDGIATISGTPPLMASNAKAAPAEKTNSESILRPNRIETLTIRPPLAVIQPVAENTSGTGTQPLNFFTATTFTDWESQYFTAEQLGDTQISGDLADPDHDGLGNLLEYALNLTPTAAVILNQPYPFLDSNYVSLTYIKALVATDLTYTIEESTNLTDWQPVIPLNAILSDDGYTQTIRAQVPRSHAGGAGTLYLRLRVSR